MLIKDYSSNSYAEEGVEEVEGASARGANTIYQQEPNDSGKDTRHQDCIGEGCEKTACPSKVGYLKEDCGDEKG